MPDEVPIVGKVTLQNYNYPEGYLLEVPGLGGIENFGTKDISLVQATMYEQATGQRWPVVDGKPQDLVLEFGGES
jgi:hypothetical protein